MIEIRKGRKLTKFDLLFAVEILSVHHARVNKRKGKLWGACLKD